MKSLHLHEGSFSDPPCTYLDGISDPPTERSRPPLIDDTSEAMNS